ncbi:MAG TPA: caspase family protein [Pirellulales bacterium]|nr:caspase family protein [Pirellulales bacterium]
MVQSLQLLPKYQNSWAIVIGINDYAHCSPLDYARNDAQAIAATLVENFGFLESSLEIFVDKQASRSAILKALLRHTDPSTANKDDRGLVFFAGHGHTARGRRGEVGYLVPADGDCDDLSSLVRWDELTRNAELLPAKHVLFIMDACYGGLAVTRHLAPGSRRFLKDMLMRHSRQVLTAGKADEEVSDGDGPRPGNSIFTGHLLDALDGAAATKDGLLTANGVMAYVYDRVAKDQHSQQTPHYGFIEGDGDFIFSELPADLLSDDATGGRDVLIDVPAELIDQDEPSTLDRQTAMLKEYLSEPRYRIKLDDLVSASVRGALKKLGPESMPVSTDPQTAVQEFPSRLTAYEEAIRPLQSAAILLGKWATAEHRAILANLFARLSDHNVGPKNGLNLWLGLRWYPISFLLYTGGIASISAGNYEALSVMHGMRIQGDPYDKRGPVELIIPVVEGLLDVQRTDIWKRLPGQERHYTPHSEYMFKAVQPVLEDVLFLGASYERMFDRYEVLRALIYADLDGDDEHTWAPIGRFGWKYAGRRSKNDPFAELCAEAAARKDDWPPLAAGLFQSSFERFLKVATRFEQHTLQRLGWS